MTASPAIEALLMPQAEGSSDDALEAQRIRAAQEGHMEAFGWLVRRHEARLFGFCCRWLRCAEDAREVCQDTFLRAWQALPEYESRARLSTWLYQIALNLCRDRAKTRVAKQRAVTVMLDEIEPPACGKSTPDSAAEWSSEAQKLHRGLAALPEQLREVLVLTAVEGLSQEEAGEVLGCSARAVEGRVYRARQSLLEWWKDER